MCSHEIAHLRESAAQKLTRLAGVVVLFPLFTMPVLVHEFGLPGLIGACLFTFVGGRLLRRFSQRMETRADAAVHAENEDVSAYARALEAIYRFNVVPAVMGGKIQTHPDLYDRLLAAGLPPEYPRPKAPSLSSMVMGLIVVVAVVASALFVLIPRLVDAFEGR